MKKFAKATEINKRIKEARERSGLTQKEFSGRIGISRSFLSEIEAGKVKPSIETLIGMILHFEVDTRWLLVGEGSRPPVGWAAESPSEYRSKTDPSTSFPLLPILDDRVVAGPPRPLSEKEIAGYIPIWDAPPRKRGYCFYAQDDGMAPLLRKGALVGITPFSGALKKLEGKLIAAWLSKEGLVVRRFHFDRKYLILEPENKAYSTLYLERSDRAVLFDVDWWRQGQR